MLTQLINVGGMSQTSAPIPIATQISGPQATLYVMNLSNQSYFLDFMNGNIAHIPPWWARPFCIPASVKWMQLTVAKSPIGMPNPPFAHVAVETYLLAEDVSRLTDTAINTQVSVQGNTSSNVTIAQTLQNDGNTTGTIIGEATPAGGITAFVLTNAGHMTLGDATANGGNLLINGVAQINALNAPGANPINLDPGFTTTVGKVVNNGANFSVVGAANIQLGAGNVAASVIDAFATGSTFLKGATGIIFQIPNGSTQATLDNGGILSTSGYKLNAGSASNYAMYVNGMSRINNFPVSGSGTFTVNHGLGGTPSYATIICDSGGSEQVGLNTFTSTTVTVTLGSNLHANGLALRY